jgi:DNA gyrase subunit B
MSRTYPRELLLRIAEAPVLSVAQLNRQDEVEDWIAALAGDMTSNATAHYRMAVLRDSERSLYLPCCDQTVHGVRSRFPLTPDFLDSAEYRALTTWGRKFKGLLEPGAYVARGERRADVANFQSALAWLMQEARRGYSIQRYKGLGEMNPDQLWDTTMNPETRRLLKVTVEDAIAADQMFSTLMGDIVEPRREFIEANALSVANLDI